MRKSTNSIPDFHLLGTTQSNFYRHRFKRHTNTAPRGRKQRAWGCVHVFIRAEHPQRPYLWWPAAIRRLSGCHRSQAVTEEDVADKNLPTDQWQSLKIRNRRVFLDGDVPHPPFPLPQPPGSTNQSQQDSVWSQYYDYKKILRVYYWFQMGKVHSIVLPAGAVTKWLQNNWKLSYSYKFGIFFGGLFCRNCSF